MIDDKTIKNSVIRYIREHRSNEQAINILNICILYLTNNQKDKKILGAKKILKSYKINFRLMKSIKLKPNDLDLKKSKAREHCFLINKAIMRLADNKERVILKDYYINGLNSDFIADKLYISNRQFFRDKKQALINFYDVCRI